MDKPRIIIADTDISYALPLQLNLVEEFFGKVEIEVITDEEYYNRFFAVPQKVDILIISEDLYDDSLQRHNIDNIFLMTEQYEDAKINDLNVNRIFKYTSIKEILNEIIGRSAGTLEKTTGLKKDTQIVLVYSACGGVGKTTVAMGISACLSKHYKRVLYINAENLQSFQRMTDNKESIGSSDVYTNLTHSFENAYKEIKQFIRREQFSYLPPFKAALTSLGLNCSIYEKIVIGAKESADYDYIIVDTDSSFDEEKVKLIDLADKVVIVTKQSETSVFATNCLASNINGSASEKYIYVCNDFNKECNNALISQNMTVKFTVNEYIEHLTDCDSLRADDLAKKNSIQRIAFLI